jgi:hypothetical protein
MRLQRLMLLGAALLATTACEKDAGPFTEPERATAFVRYVHAVADTGALELRFVDKVEGSAWFGQPTFRTVTNYFGIDAGQRRMRVFPAGTNDINIVTQVIVDTTINFEAGRYYTILHAGNARAGGTPRQRFIVIPEERPAVASGQIGVRVINANATSAVDVYTTAGASDALPSSAAIRNVAFGTASSYSLVPTGALAFRVTGAGTSSNVLASALAPAGTAAASSSQSRQGGYTQGGSLLTAFLFPAGLGANAAVAAPSIVWMQDNEP